MPKHSRRPVNRYSYPAADKTIRKMDMARGPPKLRGRFVTGRKIRSHLSRTLSLAASEDDVLTAGY